MSELKPCPKCLYGEVYLLDSRGVDLVYRIKCSCGLVITSGTNKDWVIDDWNTQPRIEALEKKLKEIRELVEDCKSTCGTTTGHGMYCSEGWECEACSRIVNLKIALDKILKAVPI